MSTRPRRAGIASVAILVSLSLAACGSGFNSGEPTSTPVATQTANTNEVSVLIGSSGAAETDAVKAAVSAWSSSSGITAKVIVASNLDQEAAQGFSSGKPADILYTGTNQLDLWAQNGSLEPYGDQLANKADFFPKLVEAFTNDGQFYCAPKDFSTLQLVINTDMWTEAGLTDADVPTNWDQLATVAKKLTKGKRVGLAFGPELQRVGAFFAQNGGGVVSAEDDATATANNDANVQALTYVKKLMTDGSAAFTTGLGAGWGGEALGKELTAMTIEGNWITGVTKDFPKLKYKVVELPAGTQKGTLQFTNCWGLSEDGDNKAGAIKLVEYLTQKDQQLAFAKAFGVMPSIQSASEEWKAQYPAMVPFIAGADYAQNLPAQADATAVIADFNSSLGQLKTKDPKALLDDFQGNLETAISG